jgi:molybdopterin molybdotransferase
MKSFEQHSRADRFHRTALKVKDAKQRIRPFIHLQQLEKTSLLESLGRVLAEDIIAPEAMPHFCRSGVDGFAIHSDETVHASPTEPVELEVIEDIPCGSVPRYRVKKGQASRIMTGAMLPEGADAVVMLEMCEEASASNNKVRRVSVKKSMHPSENVAHVGVEVQPGELLIPRGTKVGAAQCSVLAAFGFEHISVYSKPKVAIFATGSELLEVGQPLEPGKIRNSNAYLVSALVREAGGEPIQIGTIPDDAEQAEAAILHAFQIADMVLTSGGVSVGDYDVLVDVLSNWSGQLLFNKIGMRPGSPTSAGVLDGKFLFALSGNPGACFVGFELFVRPALLGMLGLKRIYPKEIQAYLAEDFTKGIAVERYVRGTLVFEQGKVWAKPLPRDKSSMMVSTMDTEVLIVIPPGGKGATAGELVTVLQLDGSKG